MEKNLQVNDIMTKEVVTFSPDMPISDAANVLVTRNFTGAPVVDEYGKLAGIVTEADFLIRGEAIHLPTFLHLFSQVKVFHKDEARFKQEFYKFLNTKVKDIMTKEVITVEPEVSVEELARFITLKRINPVPVVSQGKLVGIVSRSDIVKIFQL